MSIFVFLEYKADNSKALVTSNENFAMRREQFPHVWDKECLRFHPFHYFLKNLSGLSVWFKKP